MEKRSTHILSSIQHGRLRNSNHIAKVGKNIMRPIFFFWRRFQVQKEEEQVGSVAGDVYATYIQAAGGWCLALTVVLGVLFGQGF